MGILRPETGVVDVDVVLFDFESELNGLAINSSSVPGFGVGDPLGRPKPKYRPGVFPSVFTPDLLTKGTVGVAGDLGSRGGGAVGLAELRGYWLRRVRFAAGERARRGITDAGRATWIMEPVDVVSSESES